MTLKTYTAIYDHGRIVWDTPDQPPEQRARVFITVVEPLDADDADVGDWQSLSVIGLAAAYGSDEPDYTVEDVRFQ